MRGKPDHTIDTSRKSSPEEDLSPRMWRKGKRSKVVLKMTDLEVVYPSEFAEEMEKREDVSLFIV